MATLGAVTGGPRGLLRVEGLVVLTLAVVLYSRAGSSWWLFGALFLVPDVSLAGYLGGARAGSIAYNTLHTYLGPALVAAIFQGTELGLPLALIWAAHIGMDRAVGLGLKYASAFRDTHLGTVGELGR